MNKTRLPQAKRSGIPGKTASLLGADSRAIGQRDGLLLDTQGPNSWLLARSHLHQERLDIGLSISSLSHLASPFQGALGRSLGETAQPRAVSVDHLMCVVSLWLPRPQLSPSCQCVTALWSGHVGDLETLRAEWTSLRRRQEVKWAPQSTSRLLAGPSTCLLLPVPG